MQPLPETTAALAALASATDDTDEVLVEEFDNAAATTRRIAPECVGLTLTFVQDGSASPGWPPTSTPPRSMRSSTSRAGRASTPSSTAGGHHLVRRPCRRAGLADLRGGHGPRRGVQHVVDPLDEWRPRLRRAEPLRQHAERLRRAPDELAALYGGWAGGAVTNADLSFTTLARAKTAPHVLADVGNRNVAVGMIMAAHHVPEATARHTLSDVAARAGVSAGQVADILLDTRLLGPGQPV